MSEATADEACIGPCFDSGSGLCRLDPGHPNPVYPETLLTCRSFNRLPERRSAVVLSLFS